MAQAPTSPAIDPTATQAQGTQSLSPSEVQLLHSYISGLANTPAAGTQQALTPTPAPDQSIAAGRGQRPADAVVSPQPQLHPLLNAPNVSDPTPLLGTKATTQQPTPAPAQTENQFLINALKPATQALHALANPKVTNSYLGASSPNSANVPQSVESNLATAVQQSASDWQNALNTMLKVAPTADSASAIISGMKNLLSYPQQIGAPPAIAGNQTLMDLFQTLVNMRLGQGLTGNNGSVVSGTANSASSSPTDYSNVSVNSLLAGQ